FLRCLRILVVLVPSRGLLLVLLLLRRVLISSWFLLLGFLLLCFFLLLDLLYFFFLLHLLLLPLAFPDAGFLLVLDSSSRILVGGSWGAIYQAPCWTQGEEPHASSRDDRHSPRNN